MSVNENSFFTSPNLTKINCKLAIERSHNVSFLSFLVITAAFSHPHIVPMTKNIYAKLSNVHQNGHRPSVGGPGGTCPPPPNNNFTGFTWGGTCPFPLKFWSGFIIDKQ